MANKRGKAVDTTCLSLDQAEARGFIHRDYLAHCLRWSHVVSYLHHGRRYQTHNVLDIGCGREMPLAKLLFSSRMTHTTGSYTGVDYGPLERPDTIAESDKFKMFIKGKADFVHVVLPHKKYDTVVCFEMLEHVEPEHSFNTLSRIREVLAKDGLAFISTPCYDEKTGAADNHVNEMTYDALAALIKLAGLEVAASYGTFASQKDYKKLMNEHQSYVFEVLSEYYDSNVLSCIMAPMFPKQSRNCLWVLRPGRAQQLTPEELKQLSAPHHSSSKLWTATLKRLNKQMAR